MAGREVPTLKSVAFHVLKPLFHIVDDVGDAGFDLVKDLLAGTSAAQLHKIEARSPHLMPDTEALWKELCIKDFVQVRIAVEDDLLEEEPKSWRALHKAETIVEAEKRKAISQRLKGAYKNLSDKRATSGKIDGVAMQKQKKLNSRFSGPSRPKTLMEKARANTKQIRAIHAPKRRPGIPIPALPSAAPQASSSSNSRPTASPRKPPATIRTITRTIKVPAPPPSASLSTSARSTPTPSNLKGAPPSPLSPPTVPYYRPTAPLPQRRPSAASPPPPASASAAPRPHPYALSPPPPPPPGGSRLGTVPGERKIGPSSKALNAIFLKRKR